MKHIFRKITAVSVTAAMTAAMAAMPVMAADEITVFVNGSQLDFTKYDNVLPYIENDYTLIPLRAIVESLGLDVA